MKNISIDLSKILPNKIFKMLYDVVRVSSDLAMPVFIIGATTRDIIMQGVYDIKVPRATDDLDFGVAAGTWGAYEQLKSKLIDKFGFRQDRRQEQRLWRDDEKIDIVPFGGIETVAGEIAFPPSGDFRMSTVGFPEAFDDAISVPIEDLTVRIASLRGIVLLKFIAYSDRPAERAKDVQDILFIAKNYLDAGADEKLYESETDLLDDDFDYALAGAGILGRDVAAIASPNAQKVILTELEGYVTIMTPRNLLEVYSVKLKKASKSEYDLRSLTRSPTLPTFPTLPILAKIDKTHFSDLIYELKDYGLL